LSDALDEARGIPGACALLKNLIPDPANANTWQARPAATLLTDFAGFNAPGFISVLQVRDGIAYGLIDSERNPGKDEPFAYDIAAGAFLTVSGITAGNTPATVAGFKDDYIAQMGSRLIVTHPGFSGAGGVNAVQTLSITGGPTGGTFTLVFKGQTTAPINYNDSAGAVQTALRALSTVGTPNVVCAGGPLPGTPVTITFQGPLGKQPQPLITIGANSLSGGTTPTPSVASTTTGHPDAYFGVFDISTPGAPVWDATNTLGVPLPLIPVAAEQFMDRIWFAVNPTNAPAGTYFTDAGVLTITSGTQVITYGDSVPIITLHGLPFKNQGGGIIQSLMVFKGSPDGTHNIYQVTGDVSQSTTTDLATGSVTTRLEVAGITVNALNVQTTTLSSAGVATSPKGLFFLSPDGVRLINQEGVVSDPVGQNGTGVAYPFIGLPTPEEVAISANARVLRISYQNFREEGAPYQEVWFDFALGKWSGPHTFPASLISNFGASFVLAPRGVNAALYRSDTEQTVTSTFVENGEQMQFELRTAPMHDLGVMSQFYLAETSVCMSFGATSSVTLSVLDEIMGIVGQASYAVASTSTFWDQFNWDEAVWDGATSVYRPRQINWPQPVVYRRAQLSIVGENSSFLRLGDIFLREQSLGYSQQIA
jgi:hypothetical protein